MQKHPCLRNRPARQRLEWNTKTADRRIHFNTAPEKTVVLYTMDASNEMVRIILEPDEKMLEALRAGVPKAADRMDE